MKNARITQAAMIVAAIAAMSERHYGHDGAALNRREYRKRYGKSKGGGHGVGSIAGLPRVRVPNVGTGNWHMQNRAGWRAPRVPKSERTDGLLKTSKIKKGKR